MTGEGTGEIKLGEDGGKSTKRDNWNGGASRIEVET